jgi:hypothetical protein
LKIIYEQAQKEKDATVQEQSYLCNIYNYAKEAVAGTIGSRGDSPQFPVEVPIYKKHKFVKNMNMSI